MTRERKVLDHGFKMRPRGPKRKDNITPGGMRTRLKREKVKEAIDSHKCECLFCGSDDKSRLEWHHYDFTRKPRNVYQINSVRLALEEISHCWVLCDMCHKKYHLGSVMPLPSCYD